MSGDRFDLSGKVVVITGATKGMGATIADQFAERGARLVINSRSQSDAQAKADELNTRHGGGKIIAVAKAGSIAEKADLQGLVDTAIESFGKLTTLVLSPSGGIWLGSAIDTPDEAIDDQFLHVFRSKFWISSMAIPHMKQAGGGSIIYIGSGSPFESTGERCINTCARAAEVQLMKNLAAEFGKDNIRVNIIAPGMVQSHGAADLFASAAGRDRIAKLPMRRGGSTEEIASAAVFLAADASSFTTGGVIPVDGGRMLHAVYSLLTDSEGAAGGGGKH